MSGPDVLLKRERGELEEEECPIREFESELTVQPETAGTQGNLLVMNKLSPLMAR